MNYYLDTEFLEGKQRDRKTRSIMLKLLVCCTILATFYWLEFIYGEQNLVNEVVNIILGVGLTFTGLLFLPALWNSYKGKPTIDLISIGLVSGDNRTYYEVSKDFDFKDAWNRYDGYKTYTNLPGDMGTNKRKNYWIRENVLLSIHYDLSMRVREELNINFITREEFKELVTKGGFYEGRKNYLQLKALIDKYGKTNEEIAKEVKEFCDHPSIAYDKEDKSGNVRTWKVRTPAVDRDIAELDNPTVIEKHPINFYAYYADYDWVVFCWLFGRMKDLPASFPMYCRDLNQIFEEIMLKKCGGNPREAERAKRLYQNMTTYPSNDNCHNALADAEWNKKLHNFLNSL